MDRGNKLWEGHRMILPELREKILDNNKEKLVTRHLTEEALEKFDRRIKYAQQYQKPLLVTYMWGSMVQECITFSFRILRNAIDCDLEGGRRKQIRFEDIINVSLL